MQLIEIVKKHNKNNQFSICNNKILQFITNIKWFFKNEIPHQRKVFHCNVTNITLTSTLTTYHKWKIASIHHLNILRSKTKTYYCSFRIIGLLNIFSKVLIKIFSYIYLLFVSKILFMLLNWNQNCIQEHWCTSDTRIENGFSNNHLRV